MHPLHTPRDSRHKCLSAPHLYRSDTLLRLQNGAAEFLIPPARQPTHPYFHLSVALLEEKGGVVVCGRQGANPLFHPGEFSNFLCLHALSQIPAPNLSTIQPPWLCPPSPPTSFLCCFGWRSKSKTGGSCLVAAIHTDSIWTASQRTVITHEDTDPSRFSRRTPVSLNLFHLEACSICCGLYTTCIICIKWKIFFPFGN